MEETEPCCGSGSHFLVAPRCSWSLRHARRAFPTEPIEPPQRRRESRPRSFPPRLSCFTTSRTTGRRTGWRSSSPPAVLLRRPEGHRRLGPGTQHGAGQLVGRRSPKSRKGPLCERRQWGLGLAWSAEGAKSEETACRSTVEADGDPTITQAKRGRIYSADAEGPLCLEVTVWKYRGGRNLRHGLQIDRRGRRRSGHNPGEAGQQFFRLALTSCV